jgi:mevalonate kinase
LKTGEFYSRGKFLLSGEYLVLHGAKALAVPLKFGQKMSVSELQGSGILRWETFVRGELWYRATFQGPSFEIRESSHYQTGHYIQHLLNTAVHLNPHQDISSKSYLVRNDIGFNMNWGMGSSSSLLSNLAWWLNLDLFAFYRKIYHGSGFDVFCARSEGPVIYQLQDSHPVVEKTGLHPAVTEDLYFIYLGHKQDSQESVKKFREKHLDEIHSIHEVSGITDAMISADNTGDFMKLMRTHEEILSGILELPIVRDEHFSDFPGELKSLGAWGGDFVMAASSESHESVKEYFTAKGHDVIFRWKDIVL